MIGRALLPVLAALPLAQPAAAQSRASTDIAPGSRAAVVQPAAAGDIARAQGALLRGLDKVSGRSTELSLLVGEAVRFGRLEVRLGECRYPAADRDSDAFAELTITDTTSNETRFAGWMIASSPALSALDDARYDVWVVSCTDGTTDARPDLVYEPDTVAPAGGEGEAVPPEGAGPDGGETPPPEDSDAANAEAEGNG